MSEQKTCVTCSKPFLIIPQEAEFLTSHGWPLPVACPMCRQARRMKLRNERILRKTTCDKCKKEIIVSFDRKDGEVVYCKEHWLEWYESSDHLM